MGTYTGKDSSGWRRLHGRGWSRYPDINMSAKHYNNELISVSLPIPEDYTCTGDGCWFRVTYDYTGTQVHDTTSWTAYITGNPIRLVE